MTLRAIETAYNGYRFRSRLEARWAVFFDALDIAYEYELQGFVLGDGTRYLPDFRLPTFSGGMWCEVKPNGSRFAKALQFADESHERMWLCEGTPTFAIYRIASWEPEIWGERVGFDCGVPNAWNAHGENRMFTQPCDDWCRGYGGVECSDVCNQPCKIELPPEGFLESYQRAVYAARQARFEFGETPTP